jgi:hypothetical protein
MYGKDFITFNRRKSLKKFMNFSKHEFIRLVECHAILTLSKRLLRCVIYDISSLFISVELVLRKMR